MGSQRSLPSSSLDGSTRCGIGARRSRSCCSAVEWRQSRERIQMPQAPPQRRGRQPQPAAESCGPCCWRLSPFMGQTRQLSRPRAASARWPWILPLAGVARSLLARRPSEPGPRGAPPELGSRRGGCLLEAPEADREQTGARPPAFQAAAARGSSTRGPHLDDSRRAGRR